MTIGVRKLLHFSMVWAGVLPVTTHVGQPEADPRLTPDIEAPDHIRDLADTDR